MSNGDLVMLDRLQSLRAACAQNSVFICGTAGPDRSTSVLAGQRPTMLRSNVRYAVGRERPALTYQETLARTLDLSQLEGKRVLEVRQEQARRILAD